MQQPNPPQALATSAPPKQPPKPSSSTDGFFQAAPSVQPQHLDDLAFQRALTLFLPTPILDSLTPELSSFSQKVLIPRLMTWVHDAEHNPPYTKSFSTWGERHDVLITSEGWRKLQAFGIREGIVAIPYESENAEFSRLHQFAKYHLWAGSAAWVNCPSLMVDGVAALLRKCISEGDGREVLRRAYERLVSREEGKAWTTGQWMTERAGGSDVSLTETLATFDPEAEVCRDEAVKAVDGSPLGPWRLDGFKWFSSATDADMVVMLARTEKGVSTFFAPMRKTVPPGKRDVLGHETELNGISIQRLKTKLGTRALPTAELVLTGTRGYLIGEEGRGTKEIATVLNIARIHNGFTAIGLWGRGLSVVRAFGRARKVGQKGLLEKSAYVATLARMHVEYRTNVLFNYFIAGLLGVVEQEQIQTFRSVVGGKKVEVGGVGQVPGLTDARMAEHLLRLLTPALKGVTAKTAIAGLAECMECMGGVGYLENDDQLFNLARLYRDANVLSIWEGTTDMMAHNVLRVVFGKTREQVLEAVGGWINGVLADGSGRFRQEREWLKMLWGEWKGMVRETEKGEIEMRARGVMEQLAGVVQGALLVADAESDGDEIAADVLAAWLESKPDFRDRQSRSKARRTSGWKAEAARNLRVVYGSEEARAKL